MEIAAGASIPPRRSDGRLDGVDWTPKDVGIGVALAIAALFAPSLIVIVPLIILFDEHSRPFLATLLAMSGVSSLLIAGIALRFSVVKYHAKVAALGLGNVHLSTFGWALAALAGAFAVNYAYSIIVSVAHLTFLEQEACDQIPKDIHDDRFLLSLVAFYAIAFAPFAEELFFRGFALQGIARAWGPVAGVLISGTMFGAFHLVGNPELYKSLVPLAGVGIVFGAVFHRSASIVSTMTAHFAFNVVGSVALFTTTCT